VGESENISKMLYGGLSAIFEPHGD